MTENTENTENNCAKQVGGGSIWRASDVNPSKVVKLTRWSIKSTPEGCFFVGHDGFQGRVSTAVVKFDKEAMTGQTESGKIYVLQGPAGHNMDAEWVWDRCSTYGDRGIHDPKYDDQTVDRLVEVLGL